MKVKKSIVYTLLALIIFSACEKNNKDENILNKLIEEDKTYFFSSTSYMHHPYIHSDENNEIIDTTWNTTRNLTYSIYFHQDTILNDTLYKFVWYKTLNQNYKIGVIRETDKGKVYYRRNPYYPEELLYDFQLEVNDSFDHLIVKGKRTIWNNNIQRKELILEQCCQPDTLIWIDGIGNTRNLIDNSFAEECACYENGLSIIASTTGGWAITSELLFVSLNEHIIYNAPNNIKYTPENFEYIDEYEYY